MKKITYFLTTLILWGIIPLSQAQPTFFKVRVENVGTAFPFIQSGIFNTPVDSIAPGPLFPGAAYEFNFDAAPGNYLSLATMFVQSNDLFYAPDEAGIALYDMMGNPVSGDLTAQLSLWDAGTELNETPGEGPNQAPRQGGANMGAIDPDNTVRLENDAFTYPATADVIKLTLTHNGGTSFTARIENQSTGSTLMLPGGGTVAIPLSPGVFVIHSDPEPLFTVGMMDRGEGLEAIAEDGDATASGASAQLTTGITPILSPGSFTVHGSDDPIFTAGMPDRGEGLEGIAEDGSPGMLATTLRDNAMMTTGAFAVPVGSMGPGPLLPGGSYEFIVASGPSGRLTFTTMFVQSNDLFYAPDGAGIALFDMSGAPISGDITASVDLWDAGTELNEIPGIGVNQAPRQSGANTGAADTDVNVRLVNDGYTYPADESVIKVTLTPLQAKDFTVRIENVSTPETLDIGGGNSVAVPLAPGAWAIHSVSAPMFTAGESDRGLGLEAVAEDGDATALGNYLSGKMGTPGGAFNTPVDSAGPGPLFPGASYEFTISAVPGTYLSLATMFVQSNDLFYAPDEMGVALFDDMGEPVSGDITSSFDLWDGGTELNQQPGVGMDQAPRQSGPNVGAVDTDNLVRLVSDTFTYPSDEAVIKVTLTAGNNTAINPLLSENSPLTELVSYPNPFTEKTTLRIELSERLQLGIEIYNMMGQKVRTLAPIQSLTAGVHEFQWDGQTDNGNAVQSGVYVARLQSGNGVASKVLVRQ